MSRLSLAGSWMRFWRLAEDDTHHPRLAAEFGEDVPVMDL